MPIRYRRAKVGDIPRTIHLLEPERPLFSPDTWAALPQMLGNLLGRGRILLCIVDDSESQEPLLLGGSGFLSPSFLSSALHHPDKNLLDSAFASELEDRPAFLNTKQIAAANRRADLRLFTFFGTPRRTDPYPTLIVGASLEAWTFLHKGYQLHELWNVAGNELHAELLKGTGMRLVRHATVPSGEANWLFQFTKEDAANNPSSQLSVVLHSQPPRFGFTIPQQQLLELALLDYSDRQAEVELRLTSDAVKKRWRAIYEKIARVDPNLLARDSGADRRRALLQRLRHNLEELRPW